LQAIGQAIGGDARQITAQLAKASGPDQEIADDEQGPAFPEDLDGTPQTTGATMGLVRSSWPPS
jgi:hypothetical protein